MHKTFLIISILITACQGTSELKGIWQLSYTRTDRGVNFTHGTTLLDFSDNSVSFVQIGNPETGEIDTVVVQTKNYSIKDSLITIHLNEEPLTLKLHSISEDSLTFSINTEHEIQVAKKIEQPSGTSATKSDFAGRGFELLNGEYFHKLDFVDDSLVFGGGYHSVDRWTITTYKGFDFLNTSNWFFPKVPIYTLNGDLLALTNYGKESAKFNILKRVRSVPDLVGNWIEYERQPRPPIFINSDTLQSLQITQDSIRIKRFDRSIQYALNLSFDGSTIHFANATNNNWNLRTPMEILELSYDNMIILERHHGDSTIVKYKSW